MPRHAASPFHSAPHPLAGSAFDTPVTADSNRILGHTGALASVTRDRRAHNFRTGFGVIRAAAAYRPAAASANPGSVSIRAAILKLTNHAYALNPISALGISESSVP
jgi:hypothetical protein